MRCQKCGGFTTPEKIQDNFGGFCAAIALRCINCGELFDPIINENKQRSLNGQMEN